MTQEKHPPTGEYLCPELKFELPGSKNTTPTYDAVCAELAALRDALRELTDAVCEGRYEDPNHDRIFLAIRHSKKVLGNPTGESPTA